MKSNWGPTLRASDPGGIVEQIHQRNSAGPLEPIVRALDLHPYRDGWRGTCPLHGGVSGESFQIKLGHAGELRMTCWKGCGYAQLYDELARRGLVTPVKGSKKPGGRRNKAQPGRYNAGRRPCGPRTGPCKGDGGGECLTPSLTEAEGSIGLPP